MSKFSELDIERQETGKKVSIQSATMAKKEKPKNPSESWGEYWHLCRAVVDSAGELAAKDKLLMNYRDKSNCGKVKHVIVKSFGGNVNQLKDARTEWMKRFFKAVDEVNWYSRNHDLAQVSAMKLMGMLEDGKDREKFRRHIDRHIQEGHPPFELDELPARDFRKTRG